MTVVDFLRSHNVPHKTSGDHHCRRGWIQIQCPYCDSGKWHLGWNLRGNYFHCWKCAWHPTVETFQLLTNASIEEIKTTVKAVDNSMPQPAAQPAKKLVIPTGVGPLLPAHKTYLRNRKFNPNELEQVWKIGGIGIAANISWSIYIPVFNPKWDRQLSWTCRRLGDTGPRYISADEGTPLKTLLYGPVNGSNSVIVVEGPTDVWSVGIGAVCTFGTAYTSSQLLKLSKYPVRVVCFDKDARKESDRLCRDLEVFPGETYQVSLESGTDPASADREEIIELRKFIL